MPTASTPLVHPRSAGQRWLRWWHPQSAVSDTAVQGCRAASLACWRPRKLDHLRWSFTPTRVGVRQVRAAATFRGGIVRAATQSFALRGEGIAERHILVDEGSDWQQWSGIDGCLKPTVASLCVSTPGARGNRYYVSHGHRPALLTRQISQHPSTNPRTVATARLEETGRPPYRKLLQHPRPWLYRYAANLRLEY